MPHNTSKASEVSDSTESSRCAPLHKPLRLMGEQVRSVGLRWRTGFSGVGRPW
jgi:hypothetical protein